MPYGRGFQEILPKCSRGDRGQGLFVCLQLLWKALHFWPHESARNRMKLIFKDQFGYAPTVIPTAIDMLTVYVHKDNPINGLSLQQVDAIFSRIVTAECRKIRELGQLGPPAFGKANRYGCTAEILQAEHTDISKNMLFSEETLNQVFKNTGSSSVIQSIATSFWDCYSGIGYKTAAVRAIPLSSTERGKLVTPNAENAYGNIPLFTFFI